MQGQEASKVEWLSWKGYSERKKVSLSGWNNGFAFPSRIFEKIPYCIESYDVLREMDTDDRVAIQKDLFERTSHSVMSTAYLGMIRAQDHTYMLEQLKLCLQTMLRLMQILAADDIDGRELTKIFESLPAESSRQLRTALSSSLYFYCNGKLRKPFEKILKDPLYLELGIDVLSNQHDLRLAEFQVRYATPYPHLIKDMSDAYAAIFPQLFKKFNLQEETFQARRKKLLEKTFEAFCARSADPVSKMVIDAWAYLENSGANLKPTAKELDMEYVLFDDLARGQNIYERANRNKRLFIFNQAPLNLLDPQDDLFHRVNVEKLENYDELAWVGLLEKYLKGEAFFANSPVADILNDKAIYPAIPDLCKLFFDREIVLPIVSAMPCWSDEDHTKINEKTLEWARANKDQAVIAHRYLEGGLGIIVGPVTSKDEWESFIDTFVSDRPYLYVIRDYFAMDPDFSLRFLTATAAPQLISNLSDAEMEFSDTIFARLTTESPLSTDNHRSILIFRSAAGGENPRYIFQESSNR